jgi:serine/threonine protein kinase
MDLHSTSTSKPGVIRYMAPELLNPLECSVRGSAPSEEGDIYSLAMTAYEVLSSYLVGCTIYKHLLPMARSSRRFYRMV